MRNTSRWRGMAVLALVALTMSATPAVAQKGKPGGGGGDSGGGGGGVVLPNVRYAIGGLDPTSNQLTPLPSGMRNINGMNNEGIIVGDHHLQYNDALNLHPVVIMPDGTIYSGHDLDLAAAINGWSPAGGTPPPGYRIRSAVDVNEHGLIVGAMGDGVTAGGYVLDTRRSADPVDWDFFALPTLGSSYSYGKKVNDEGDILTLYRRPGGTAYDWYLYNYDAPSVHEPMFLNLPGSYPAYGLNNRRQVLLADDLRRPVIFEEGRDLRIFTDIPYPSHPNPGHNLNDDGVFAWQMGGFGKGKHTYNVAVRRAIDSGTTEQLMDVQSVPNGVNQQSDVLLASVSSGWYLFHDEAGLLPIVDLIPDADPLKEYLVANSPWYRKFSDRSPDPEDSPELRFPEIIGTVKTADGNYHLFRLTPYLLQP